MFMIHLLYAIVISACVLLMVFFILVHKNLNSVSKIFSDGGGKDKANKSVIDCQEVSETEMQTMLNELSSGDQTNIRVSMAEAAAAAVLNTGGLDAQNRMSRANMQSRLN